MGRPDPSHPIPPEEKRKKKDKGKEQSVRPAPGLATPLSSQPLLTQTRTPRLSPSRRWQLRSLGSPLRLLID